MGSDVTPSSIRGFLQPIRLTKDHFWTAASTYTQKDPIAGMPTPQGPYNLVVSSSGDQNDISDITIKTHRSGSVAKQTGATFTWRETGTTTEHGHEHAVQSGYEVAKAETTTMKYSKPQVTSNKSGDLFVVHVGYSTVTLKYSIEFAYRSQSEGTWTNTTISSGLTLNPHPCICMLDDDTILVVHWTEPATDIANLSSLKSTDKGSNWKVLSDNVLFDDISTKGSAPYGYTVGRLSMGASQDHVLIFADLQSKDPAITYNLMGQFTSNNRGGAFLNIGITSTGGVSYDRGKASVTVNRGEFYISFIRNNDFVYLYHIPNPYYDLTNLDANLDDTKIIADLVIATGSPLTGENALFSDTDGTFYNINRCEGGSNTFNRAVIMSSSRQDAQSWQGFSMTGASSSTAFNPNPLYSMDSSTINLQEIDACITQGRIAVVSSFLGDSSINDSIVVHYYGGYTTRTQGSMRSYPKYTDLASYIVTWSPLQLPDTGGEFTPTGGGSATLSVTGLDLQNIKHYTATRTTTTTTQGYSIRASFKQLTSGSTTEIIKISTSDGASNSYSASIRCTQLQIEIYDNVGAASVGSATVTTSTGIEILVSMRDDKVYVWYQRFKGASYDKVNEYKTWALLTSTALTNDNHTTITASALQWGCFNTVHNVVFYEFAYSLGSYTGLNLTGDTALIGRSYPYQGSNTYVNGGMSITTRDGPAFTDDEYIITKTAEFPVERILPTVATSPRVAWRSIPYTGSSGGDMKIAFYLDTTIKETTNSDIGGDLLGLYLGNINFHKFKIQYYNTSTAAWVDLSTINTYEGMRFNYTREGASVIYSGTEIDKFYLYHGESIGWTILLEDSSGDFHACEIAHNTEGSFAGASYDRAKRPVIRLKGASSSLPTSGEARLIPKNVAITVALLGVKSPAWAIEIQDSTTLSGDYQIGSLLFGPVIIQAPQYARGRSITLQPHINVVETQDSAIYTQKMSDPTRSLRVSWSTGVSLHSYYDGVVEPDYYMASTQAGALPVASYDDIPYQIEGLYRYLEGASLPLVYLPKIDKDTGSKRVQVHNRRESHLYGVTMGDMTMENMLGDEMKNEVLRVSSITIKEVI